MSNRMLTLMMGMVAFLILAVGAVFVIALAGGSDDDDTTPGASGDDERPRSSGDGICSDNSLIVPGSDPASVLDPIQVADVATSEYVVEIFGGLVTLDTDLKVQPDIAQEWEVSNGGKTYTFKLRNNVVFHTSNTRPVTAGSTLSSRILAAAPR